MPPILQITFPSDPATEELVQTQLYLAGCEGSRSAERDGATVVTAYFPDPASRDLAGEALRAFPLQVERAEEEQVNWLERYQQSLAALEIGSRFVVAPDASLLPAGGGRLPIVVPQELAFGTGSHESTALCMALLEEVEVLGGRVLDVGAGSGILALASLRLGAARAIAFDIDPDAYAALRDNRARNGIDPSSMPLFIGGMEALRGGTFRLIFMNILPEVIIPLLPQVMPRLAEGGAIIASGVLTSLRGEVLAAAASHGLEVAAERTAGEWWAGRLQRRR